MVAIEQRFMNHIEEVDGCWLWQGYLYHGYGKFRVGDKLLAAHRFAYELFIGEIPKGLVIDHICHNQDTSCTDGKTCLHRSCVNPSHLEAVTTVENLHRTPHWLGNWKLCKRGHEFSPTRIKHNGQRWCAVCKETRNAVQA